MSVLGSPQPSIGSLVARLSAAPARCGDTRVVLIDGPAGAGKTTLAARFAVALGDAVAQTLHGDDMYEGWEGLATLDAVLWDQVLASLAVGEPAGFRMWDWVEDRRTHRIDVPPCPFLIVEGVGVASPRARTVASLTLWVDAPWELRLARGLDRDGHSYDVRRQWEGFEADTRAVHLASGAREAADVVLDGTVPVAD